MPQTKEITNEQEIDAILNITTEGGKPAEIDGKPIWEKLSGDATIVVAEDGKSAVLKSSDTPGDSQFLVKADADVGAGVEEISDVITLRTIGARAKNLGLTLGEPRQKT